jgi:hypothetical protein
MCDKVSLSYLVVAFGSAELKGSFLTRSDLLWSIRAEIRGRLPCIALERIIEMFGMELERINSGYFVVL